MTRLSGVLVSSVALAAEGTPYPWGTMLPPRVPPDVFDVL